VNHVQGAELFACGLLSYAKSYGEKGVLRGDFKSLSRIASSAGGHGEFLAFWLTDDVIQAALEILIDARVAKGTSDPYSSGYYKIDANALGKVIAAAEKEHLLCLKTLEKADSEGDMETILDPELMDRFPLAKAHSHYPILKHYNEFGDDWLQRQLKSVNEQRWSSRIDPKDLKPDDAVITQTVSEPKITYHPPTDSRDWMGVAAKIDGARLLSVKNQIGALVLTIDQSECDDRTKRNAKKHAEAIVALLDAPDPPWKLIVELLNSPVLTAFLNTAAVLALIFGS
jgi:hypothetical protein